MLHHWFGKSKGKSPLCKGGLGGISLLLALALLFAIACGAAATATPAPAAKAAAPAVAPAAPVAAPAAASTPTRAPAATPVPSPTLSATKPVPTRLKVAVLPYEENDDPHLAGGTVLVPWRAVFEYLVEVDKNDGSYKPMLATEYTISPDGKAWTVKLRKGVQFHRGWGEFTAKDLVFSSPREFRQGSLASNAGYWRANLDNIEVINDYEVVYHLKRAELEWYHLVSTHWGSMMESKAQFDKGGQEGFVAKPAGTGPYQHVETKLGAGIVFERVPYTHWRVQPDFKELELVIVREELTRLATLLTKEAQIVEDVPLDVQAQAIAKGFKASKSTTPSGGLMGQFGGNYLPSLPSFDATIPWTKKQVRQALNLAINRQEIIDTIFHGRYEPIVAPYAHKSHREYKPEWEAKFKQNYAYDPAKARQLLKEAGYPNGFKATMGLHTQPGAPRQDAVAEAVANYWQAIGVDVKLETIERSLHTSQTQGRTKQGKAWVQLAVYRPPWNRVQIFNTVLGTQHGFESVVLEQKWAELGKTVDPNKFIQIQQDIIEYLVDEYAHFPTIWIFGEHMLDPKIVADYTTAGISGSSHLEHIKAAR